MAVIRITTQIAGKARVFAGSNSRQKTNTAIDAKAANSEWKDSHGPKCSLTSQLAANNMRPMQCVLLPDQKKTLLWERFWEVEVESKLNR